MSKGLERTGAPPERSRPPRGAQSELAARSELAPPVCPRSKYTERPGTARTAGFRGRFIESPFESTLHDAPRQLRLRESKSSLVFEPIGRESPQCVWNRRRGSHGVVGVHHAVDSRRCVPP